MKKHTIFFILVFLISILNSCKQDKKKPGEPKEPRKPKKTIIVPEFNADSAYTFIARQVAFGPRVPGTKAHEECAMYLKSKLEEYLPVVMIQKGKVRLYNNKVVTAKNIIGSYKPGDNNRVLLAAHWDSRPFADHDPNPANRDKPIDGANDGASGVGVLIEIARHVQKHQPEAGIDFIFFDVEDYGEPESSQLEKENTWCLGSQYWAKNPHKENYFARYGILLDMVGAKNATFPMEGGSMYYASSIVQKVWSTGIRLGYADYFIKRETYQIIDDHIYINTMANIPTIDIVHLQIDGSSTFFEHWHTVNDNMDVIDKKTLKAVGHTLHEVLYKQPF